MNTRLGLFARVFAATAVCGLSACSADSASPLEPTLESPHSAAAPAAEVIVLYRESALESQPALSPSLTGQHVDGAPISAATRLSSTVFASARNAKQVRALDEMGGAVMIGVSDAEMARIAMDPRVAVIERSKPMEMASIPTPTTSWALDRLDQAQLPLSSTYNNPSGTGAGVRVYIFDTGIRMEHTEFGGRVIAGPDVIPGSATGALVLTDCNGHGTLVASAAAGRTTGSATSATIVAIRVLNCAGQGTSLELSRGVDFVIAQKRLLPTTPMVINMSMGIPGGSILADEAIRRAVAANIPVVVSAGNANTNACTTSPAREPAAITVGATTMTDARASFSNFGDCVDVYAPGDRVRGAAGSPTALPNMYSLWNGTSASAPYVAGLVAAWLQSMPTATVAQVTTALIAGSVTGVVTNAPGTTPRLAQARFAGIVTPPTTSVNAAPVARLSVTCVRRACTVDSRTSSDDKSITGVTWNVGGVASPATLTASNGVVTYAVNGTYRVSLTVRDAEGLTNTSEQAITVTDAAPVARFTASCTVRDCTFQGTTSTDDGGITGYAWTFGDINPSAGTTVAPQAATANTTKRYATTGSYTVGLTVTDNVGQTHRTEQVVVVTDARPVARLTRSCVVRRCAVSGATSTDDGGISSYAWTFGDGSIGTGVSVNKTYAKAGTYTMALVVTDGLGQTHRTEQSVGVTDAAPVARLSMTCVGRTCAASGQASTDDSGIASYLWSFGDGTTATGATAQKTYSAAGTYTTTLTVTDNAGQPHRATTTVTVARATLTPAIRITCRGRTCTIDAGGTRSDIGVVGYRFATGDGAADATQTTPVRTHTYRAAGRYPVRVLVTDRLGTTATVSAEAAVR